MNSSHENAKPGADLPRACRPACGGFLLGLSLLLTLGAAQGDVDIDDVPPFVLAGNVEPNLFLAVSSAEVVGNGLATSYGWYGDGIPSTGLTASFHLRGLVSSHVNRLYFDPDADYEPPLRPNGTSFPNANFSAALSDPFHAFSTSDPDPCILDLSAEYVVAFAEPSPEARCDDRALFDVIFPTAADRAAYDCLRPWDCSNIHGLGEDPSPLALSMSDYSFPEMPLRQGEDGGFVNPHDGIPCQDPQTGDYDLPEALSGQPDILRTCSNDEAEDLEELKTAETLRGTGTTTGATVFPTVAERAWNPSAVQPPSGAYYYVFDVTRRVLVNGTEVDCDPGSPEHALRDSCYTRSEVRNRDADPSIQQRFANWFSYYRTMRLAFLSGLSNALVGARDKDLRLSLVELPRQGLATPLAPQPVATAAATVLDALYRDPDLGRSTMLSHPIMAVGEYLRDGADGAVSPAFFEDPADTSDLANARSCRRNNLALFSGLSWRDTQADYLGLDAGAQNWADDEGGGGVDLPDSTPVILLEDLSAPISDYDALPPYRDANKHFPSDVAFYYWITDLSEIELPGTSTEADDVPPRYLSRRADIDDDDVADDIDGDGSAGPEDVFWDPQNDPATWQHLSVFTLSMDMKGSQPFPFDAEGTLVSPDDYVSLFGETLNRADGGFPDDLALDLSRDPADNAGQIALAEFAQDQADSLTYKLDDVWHAAINSRGFHYRASTANDLEGIFTRIIDLTAVTGNAASAAGAAVSSGGAGSEKAIYQSRFDTRYWSGDVLAYPVSIGVEDTRSECQGKSAGDLCGTIDWSASDELGQLPTPDTSRKIGTLLPDGDSGGTTGSPSGATFTWGSFSGSIPTQPEVEAWGADEMERANRVSYLRGDQSNEIANGGGFRDRTHRIVNEDGSTEDKTLLLGDIIYSSPIFVGPPSALYSFNGYLDFRNRASSRNRSEMVYFGANDGMLHAVFADGANEGTEAFSYVPHAVWPKLPLLAEEGYGLAAAPHQNFVDGPLYAADVEFSPGDWHTVLVGAMGGGAQAVFALDITDPTFDSEASAAQGLAMWEFTDADDADLGYLFGRPAIVRIQGTLDNPRWVAIFGNGYNHNTEQDGRVGTTGRAVLFVVDIETGRLLNKLVTDAGTAEEPNGLGDVTVIDANNDWIADFAYAGDLLGNVWKFDLQQMTVGLGGDALFTATDPSGNPQPITSKIAVTRHPTGVGTLALFGTGKLLGSSDMSANPQIQTFYGIWDTDVARGSRLSALPAGTVLLEQEFEFQEEDQFASTDARTSTNRTIAWYVAGTDRDHVGWYIDLRTPDNAGGFVDDGERVVQPPDIRDNRVVFTSTIPSQNPCVTGGRSWVNALDARDGSRLAVTPFDFDLDGDNGVSDLVVIDPSAPAVPASSIRLDTAGGSGVYSSPVGVVLAGGETVNYVTTSGGEMIKLRESSALDWRVWHHVR